MRVCKKCNTEKPIELFTKQGKSYRHTCKSCNTDRVKRYYSDHPDRYEKWHERRKSLKHRRHGLTDEAFRLMVEANGQLCSICMKRAWTDIDHDHKCCESTYSCGKCVRGLLCGRCNRAAGLLDDDTSVVSRMLQYLTKNMTP